MVPENTTISRKNCKIKRTFGIKENQSNIVTDHQWALKLWGTYIQDLYDLENQSKDIAIEVEEELNEDDKGPTIIKARL